MLALPLEERGGEGCLWRRGDWTGGCGGFWKSGAWRENGFYGS